MTTTKPQSTTEPLLPCPFCGSADLDLGNGYDEDANWVVICCGCKSSGTFCVEKSKAITRWNTRTTNDLADKAVAEWFKTDFISALNPKLDRLLARLKSRPHPAASTAPVVAESPILAFQAWLERWVIDNGRKLTQDEYGIAYAAFIAAHPGEGPKAQVMAAPVVDESHKRQKWVYSKDVMEALANAFDSMKGQTLPVSEVGYAVYKALLAVPEFSAAATAAPVEQSDEKTALVEAHDRYWERVGDEPSESFSAAFEAGWDARKEYGAEK